MTSPTGIEVFADYPAATVTGSLNSTDSTDTLSVSWLTGITWPVSSTSVSPNTYFRITDPAAPSEVMLVTAAAGGAGPVSSQSWTVTRGYEGTPKVAHSAGFTINQIVSSGTLQHFKQTPSAGTSPVTISTSTTETVLASYQPIASDLTAGATFIAIAFGPITAYGGTARGTLAFSLYWGGSGSVGGAYTATGGVLLAKLVHGTNAPVFAATTVIAGASFDVNGEVVWMSSTQAHANLNTWLAAGAALNTAPLVGSATDTASTTPWGSGTGPITISGNGPIFLTAAWGANFTVYGLTAVAPVIYRAA